jgi:hypothetical protein
LIGKLRAIWRILNGKLDTLLASQDGLAPRLDRAIGEAQAARAEAAALRGRLAALEQAVRDVQAAAQECAVRLPDHGPAIETLRIELEASRGEHVALAEGIAGQNASIADILSRLDDLPDRFDDTHHRIDRIGVHALEPMHANLARMRRALGRIEARQSEGAPLERSAFQVFSQDGEDGILWNLARLVLPERRRFVEFGVEDYAEANSRFLLTDGGWSGLVLDGSEENIARLRATPLYWQYNLKAETAFVTRENIDALLVAHGMGGPLGYLSIDIDGNDYWVWEAATAVEPLLVSVEFNWRFGPERAVSVPYDPAFVRQSAHPSWLYFGASLAALEKLGEKKGYALVGVSPSAVNAFFVRRELLSDSLPARTARELWQPGRFSEYHDDSGQMAKLSVEAQQALVLSLPLIEVE